MQVSNIKAISFLTFILAHFKYGSPRPHPENFKQISNRDIFDSNPMFNRVFHSRNTEQDLMRKFLERDTFAFKFPSKGNYIFRNPEDNSEDQSKVEYSSEVVNFNHEDDLKTTPKPTTVRDNEGESKEHSSMTAVMEDYIDTLTKTYENASIPEPQNKKSDLVEPTTNENKTKLLDYQIEPNIYMKNNVTTDISTYFKHANKNHTLQQELQGHLNVDKEPAPLTKQPNTLVRGFDEEDTFSHFVEEAEPERAITQIPIIPCTEKTKRNNTIKNQSVFDTIVKTSGSENDETTKGNDDDYDDEKVTKTRLYHTPAVQRNITQQVLSHSRISFKKNEHERNEIIETTTSLSSSESKKTDNQLQLMRLKPLIVQENGISKRLKESMRVLVNNLVGTSLTETTKTLNETRKEHFRGSIKGTTSVMKKNIENPLREELGLTDKLATIPKNRQKYEKNHTSDEFQNFKDTLLRIWSYKPTNSSEKKYPKRPSGIFNERNKQYGLKLSKNIFNLVPESTTVSVQKRRSSTAKSRSNPIRRITSQTRSGYKIVPPRQQLDENRLLKSILSNIFTSVITNNKIPKNSVRVNRDTDYHGNTRMPRVVLSNAARKYIAPKYFPKSGSKVFPIPGESPVEMLPPNFRQDSHDSMHWNLIDSNMEREKRMSLADIFSGEYQRALRSEKWKYYLEDFEQIM